MKTRSKPSLNSAQSIRALFRSSGGAPRRRWGQNFLIDPNWRRIIVSHILEEEEDPLLEIGPGTGALTEELLQAGRNLYAIEIDPLLAAMLSSRLQRQGGPGQLLLLRSDARQALRALIEGESLRFQKAYQDDPGGELAAIAALRERRLVTPDGEIRHIYGNLPYYLSTDILTMIAGLPHLRRATFLLQREFAERIAAADSRSSLGLFLGNALSIRLLYKIGPSALFPAPSVESFLVSLRPHPQGPLAEPHSLEPLLRISFAARRKKIRNSWKQRLPLVWPTMELQTLLDLGEECGIDPGKRAEAIEPRCFYSLASRLTPLLLRETTQNSAPTLL